MNDQSDKVWVISCPCGWSRMMPILSTQEDRLTARARHDRETHGVDPATTEGTE